MSNNVRVVCRFRPQNDKEIAAGGKEIYSIVDDASTTVKLKGPEIGEHTFTFDRIFGGGCTQKEVYEYAAKPVVEDVLKGYNGTIFVYGQTSSGKTHTMQGPDIENAELRGIIPRMNETIFDGVSKADPNMEFLVKASYIEIYKEKIRDLLDSSKQNLQVREEKARGIWVDGATEVYVSNEQDVLEVIKVGSNNRAIAETNMNAVSSRSHSIFILTVQQRNLVDQSTKAGKLYLVDLAGSEKVQKTGAQGNTLDEAKMINKSLSALGNVINALTDGKSTHVPYRDSKLTRVLQESLGGNSRTTLVINCSPSSYNETETLSTLRFGNRAKSIKNSAKVNQERSVAELKALLLKAEKEIEKLKEVISAQEEELGILRNGGVVPIKDTKLQTSLQNLPNIQKLQDRITELEESLKKLEEEKLSLTEMQESLQDELKEKEQQFLQMEQMKEELNSAKQTELTLSKENELLIVKLADMTIANEKVQYENNEYQLSVENLTAQNESFKQEIETLKKKVDTLSTERNKTNLSFASQEDNNSFETTLQNEKPKLEAEVEVDVSPETRKPKERESTNDAQLLLAKEEIKALQSQLQLQNQLIEQFKKEKEVLAVPPASPRDLENKTTNEQSETSVNPLEKELQLLRDQTNIKLSEYDSVKAALLKDLENRCQKVIELEMLLDEAREQYQTLLLQLKNSNVKALQQKCVFLQRNLEQLTAVQQQLVNENNRVKLENQVYVKQLAIRNERIHGLELLLQDAQEKLQKHAASGDLSDAAKRKTPTRNTSAVGMVKPGTKATLNAQLLQGGRIAKPLRGGGQVTAPIGNTSNSLTGSVMSPTKPPNEDDSTPPSPSPTSTPEPRRNSSFWDLFRGTKPKSDEPQSPSPSSPQQQTITSSQPQQQQQQ